MSDKDLFCWKCGGAVKEIPLPLSRRAECLNCGAELHVCRMCRFYDRSVANACREPVAEPVAEKTRANFCGYLEPRTGPWPAAGDAATGQASQQLDALFGGPAEDGGPLSGDGASDPLSELESLFGGGKKE